MIKRFLKRRIKESFKVLNIILLYFVLDGTIKMLPSDMPYYLFYAIILILFQGVGFGPCSSGFKQVLATGEETIG